MLERSCDYCAVVGCTNNWGVCDFFVSMTDKRVTQPDIFEKGDKMVNMERYRLDVQRTAPTELSTPEYLSFAALGIGAEAGELLNEIKKHIHQEHPLNIQNIVAELGDVFFYMTALMDRLEITLDEVIAVNIDKRQARFPNGFDPQGSIGRGAGQ